MNTFSKPRRFAISDIHGCLDTFNALLSRIDLQQEDELYLLGDYIDRGPDSPGVLNRIMELQHNGYQLNCLMGNHEEMQLDRYQRAAHQKHGYTDEQFLWMSRLDNYLMIPGYILVHAGLDFKSDDPLKDTYQMRWIRYWEADLDREWLGNRRIVYGHTPRPYTDIMRQVKRLDEEPALCIDAGCAFQARGLGYLVAFDLDSNEVHPMRRIEQV